MIICPPSPRRAPELSHSSPGSKSSASSRFSSLNLYRSRQHQIQNQNSDLTSFTDGPAGFSRIQQLLRGGLEGRALFQVSSLMLGSRNSLTMATRLWISDIMTVDA